MSLALTLAVFVLFLLCCWSASADAQGAVAFIFMAPVMGAGVVTAFVLALLAESWRFNKVAMRSSVGLALLLALFYVSAFLPGLRFISSGMIQLVAEGFEWATGKTPYASDKKL